MDLIYREQAIACADKYLSSHECSGDDVAQDILGELLALPSARPKGKWIKEPNCMYRCSICGSHYPSIKGFMDYNFCPNCGSDNREVE